MSTIQKRVKDGSINSRRSPSVGELKRAGELTVPPIGTLKNQTRVLILVQSRKLRNLAGSCGIGRVHRYPLAELKCVSPKWRKEISQHVRIPPAAHTYQSDVETVHRLEEDEFSIWKISSAAAISSPRSTPITCTSISRVLTLTKKI